MCGAEGLRGVGESQDQGRAGRRDGKDFEGHVGQDAERAQGADEQFRQIVAGHVLDHFPAALGEFPHRGDEVDAEDHVARRTVSQPPRAAAVGGEDSADGCLRAKGRIERQHLSLGLERRGQVRHPNSRFHRDGQIRRLIVGDAVQPVE